MTETASCLPGDSTYLNLVSLKFHNQSSKQRQLASKNRVQLMKGDMKHGANYLEQH
jgi:hypothetical protein